MEMVAEQDVTEELTYAFTAPIWNRVVSAAKTLVFSGVLIWFLVMLLLASGIVPKLRGRFRMRLATTIAVPGAIFLAARRYATLFHTLSYNSQRIELKSSWRTLPIDPLQVDGLIGASGVSFTVSEMVIWKSLVLVVDGRAYSISFDKHTNSLCYDELRNICVHAWGLPLGGPLAPPISGPELSTEEYTLALAHLKKHFLRLTQKALVTGLLMTGGSAAVIAAMLFNMNANRLNVRLMFWIGAMGFVGLILTIHAVKQVWVLRKVSEVQRRLQEAE